MNISNAFARSLRTPIKQHFDIKDFQKKTDDSTGHGNPAFHHLDLFWSLSWTGFNAQENMDDDYFAQGATLWVWFG